MVLLVASHAVLAQVRLSNNWQLDKMNVLATGLHYGIGLPRPDGSEFITMLRENNILSIYKNTQSESNTEYRQIRKFVCQGEYNDIHQIAYWDNGVYIANTGFNSIDYISFDTFSSKRCYINGLCYDKNHVNSIYPIGPNKLVVMLSNMKNKHAVSSEIAILRNHFAKGFVTEKKLSLWDKGCHNIFLDDKVLAYNASKMGDFVLVSLGSGKIIHRINFSGYTKGLSVTKDYFLVGYSDLAERDDRNTSSGYLAIINRSNLEVEATINLSDSSLPYRVGNVNEVRCLSERDFGHSSYASLQIDWDKLRLSS